MLKVKIFILILSTFLLVGCQIPQYLKDNFKYKYDGQYTGIDTLINIAGFYQFEENSTYWNGEFVFYKDGTFAVGSELENCEESKDSHIPEWGSYIIAKDTIKCQSIFSPGKGRWGGGIIVEYWYKIIDRNKLVRIYLSESNIDNRVIEYDVRDTAVFIPTSNLPDPMNWIKEERWSWKEGYYPEE